MKFCEKLYQLRKEKGVSQEGLAELLGVSRQAVSKWESGQAYPETEKMIALSQFFGVTLDNLIKDGALQGEAVHYTSAPLQAMWMHSYEYKSKRTVFGLPLVHINTGRGAKRAKGIIAIGNIATGVISLGFISCGVFSMGLVGVGLVGAGVLGVGAFALGAFSAGLFAAGAVAAGVITIGALSFGMFSVGAVSYASHIAVGHHATGHIAIGKIVSGARTFIDHTQGVSLNLSAISARDVKEAIASEFPSLWPWITNFITLFLGQ